MFKRPPAPPQDPAKPDRQPMDGRVDDDPGDIKAQVLQTTLDVIETSLQNSTEPRDGDGDGDRDGDCCVICLDTVSDPCAALPCGHTHFDFVCLASWLQQHPNCPLCKATVFKVRYADAQKGDEAFYRVPNAAQPHDTTGGDDPTGPSRTRFTSQNGLLRETNRRVPRPPPSLNEAIRHRRHIYRHELYSLRQYLPSPPFPFFLSLLPPSSPRPSTPQTNPPRRHRLKPHLPIPRPPKPHPVLLHSTPPLPRPPLDPPRTPSLFLPLRRP